VNDGLQKFPKYYQVKTQVSVSQKQKKKKIIKKKETRKKKKETSIA